MTLTTMNNRLYREANGADAGGAGTAEQGAGTGRTPNEDAAYQQPVSRPDWLPEKFWDPESKQGRFEDLAKSYADAEAKLGKAVRGGLTTEEYEANVEKQLREKIQAEAAKNRPEKPDDYEFKPVDGSLPAHVTLDNEESKALLGFMREIAFKQGLSQEDFNEGATAYLKALAEHVPDPTAERAKLGEKAAERIDRAEKWAKANLSEKAYQALEIVAATADGVVLVEELIEKTGGMDMRGDGEPARTTGDEVSKDDIRQMMNDPRYYDPRHRDPAYVKRIDDLWKKAAPGKANTAAQNPSYAR